MTTQPRSSWFFVLLLSIAASSLSAQEAAPQRLKGMSQQISVSKAADLKVTAPSGNQVAVLDQTVSHRDPQISKSVDHNNGWLSLAAGELGEKVTVKGKYFVPADSSHKPTGLRFTVRKHSKTGLLIYSDRTVKIEATQTGKWVEFAAELPIKVDATLSEPGGMFLLVSALTLAGPVYLDDLNVLSDSGAALWAYPSFE
ncbi:MAG: hypothetical protein ABW223_08960 [Rariglobus sp.]